MLFSPLLNFHLYLCSQCTTVLQLEKDDPSNCTKGIRSKYYQFNDQHWTHFRIKLKYRKNFEKIIDGHSYNSVKWKMRNSIPCTRVNQCICKRIVDQTNKPNRLSSGRASSGGSIFCGTSQSSVVRNVFLSTTTSSATSSTRCKQSYMYDKSDVKTRRCFGKGVVLDKGTIIKESVAINGNGGGIASTLCDVSMSSSILFNNRAINGIGGGIMLATDSSFHSYNSSFKSNTASHSGGGIACDQCNKIKMKNGNLFTNNLGEMNGGALYVKNSVSEMFSSDTHFFSNTAANDGGAVFMEDTTTRNGGGDGTNGGRWKSTNDQLKNNIAVDGSGGGIHAVGTKLIMNGNFQCINNKAMSGGGGCILWEPLAMNSNDILWNTMKPDISLTNQIKNNNAAYGNNYATTGKMLQVISKGYPCQSDSDGKNDGHTSARSGHQLYPCPYIKLLDVYHNIIISKYNTNMYCKAILNQTHNKYNKWLDSTPFSPATTTTTTSEIELKGEIEVLFDNNGHAIFNGLIVDGTPNSGPHTINFRSLYTLPTATIRTLNVLPMNEYTGGGGGGGLKVYIKNCKTNEYLYQSRCFSCPLNAISLEGSSSFSACKCKSGIMSKKKLCEQCNKGLEQINNRCLPCRKGK
jgi:predicted outer membrane repeat protein